MNKKALLLRVVALSVLAVLLIAAGCGKDEQGGSNEAVVLEPLTALQVQALRSRIRAGLPVGPEELGGIRLDDGDVNAACRSFLETLPDGIRKGWIEVPEDWTKPEGRKIRVFYYTRDLREHIGNGGGAVPVVFFNGGPGGSSHSSYGILDPEAVNRSLPFVYLDQRGTGCSTLYPTTVDEPTINRLMNYGTRSIVKDAEALRVRLYGAGSRWKAFGQSYGGFIVQRYIEVAPEGLTAAYAHGDSVMADPVEWLALRILSQKRVMEEYFASYPDDRARIEKIRAGFDADKCFTDGESIVCGPSVLDAATILVGFRNSWSSLHRWLAALLNADGSVNEENLELFTRYFVFGVYAEKDTYLAASVIGMLEMSLAEDTPTQCAKAQRRLEDRGEAPRVWSINECRLLSGLTNPADRFVNALVRRTDPLTIAGIARSLGANAGLPFFLYSGKLDVFVPVETFAEEVRALGQRVTYRQFDSSGHEGFHTEGQVWTDLAR